ncbi:DUF6089 family protein, partial [Xanthovirga aplysinae]|uniref:DUF6089 family protein n=1 Tax=Xanthovirga aplysinae TaxID=2529853 RepID=UPI001656C8E8
YVGRVDPLQYWSVGFEANTLNYFGDIAPTSKRLFSTNLKNTRPGLGVVVNRRFSGFFSVRSEFFWGRIAAADSTTGMDGNNIFRYARNLSFRNDIYELDIVGVIDFVHTGHYTLRPKIVPYFFAGIGFFTHNPKAKVPNAYYNFKGELIDPGPDQGKWVSLRNLETEGPPVYSRFQIAVPIGLGVRFKLNNQTDLSFEMGYRQTFTDGLDDIVDKWPEEAYFTDNDLGKIMSDRSQELAGRNLSPQEREKLAGMAGMFGNELRGGLGFDTYLVSSFKLTFILGTKK